MANTTQTHRQNHPQITNFIASGSDTQLHLTQFLSQHLPVKMLATTVSIFEFALSADDFYKADAEMAAMFAVMDKSNPAKARVNMLLVEKSLEIGWMITTSSILSMFYQSIGRMNLEYAALL